MPENNKNSITKYLLFFIIGVQPVLDVIAFWTQGASITFAGYARLAILLFTPLWLLVVLKNKKRLVVSLAVVGFFCALHIINCYRVGYNNAFGDIQYMLRVIEMPVIALCLMSYLDEYGQDKCVENGLMAACIFYFTFFIISLLSGSWNSTYGDGIGISGWVTDDNRCANSILLVTFSVFILYQSLSSTKWYLYVFGYILVSLFLLMNGTKACYYSLFVVCLAFLGYELLLFLIKRQSFRFLKVILPVIAIITAVLVYPYTPRAEEDAIENSSTGDPKELIELQTTVSELGYDINTVTMDDIDQNEDLFAAYELFYKKIICGGIPQLFDDFSSRDVIRVFNLSTDLDYLCDVRNMKLAYAELVYEKTDFLTKLFGFEAQSMGQKKNLDLENDYPALFYYYGFVGLGAYLLLIGYFIVRIIRKLVRQFKESINLQNYFLLLVLSLQLLLAEFSGAILRRPNVNIFMAVVLALIYSNTKITAVYEEKLA